MDEQNLRETVEVFRDGLCALALDGYPFQISITSRFPHACCDDSSLLLASYLSDRGLPGALRVSGTNGGREEELGSHVWLELNGLLIDITGSQFEEYDQPEILIAKRDQFLESFEILETPTTADFRVHLSHDPLFLSYFSQAYQAVLDRLPGAGSRNSSGYRVLRDTGMEPDQGVTMADIKMNDEWKPKCPRCRGMNFVTVLDDHMSGADKQVALVICSSDECQTVVGALPASAVWDD